MLNNEHNERVSLSPSRPIGRLKGYMRRRTPHSAAGLAAVSTGDRSIGNRERSLTLYVVVFKSGVLG